MPDRAPDGRRDERTGRSRVVKISPCPCGNEVAVPRDWARGYCSVDTGNVMEPSYENVKALGECVWPVMA